MSSRSRTGVTLPQVAVVLAIIAFVAAVLFPVFQKVDNHPRHGTCASNMKQLGLAMTQYSQDADENFPAGANAAGNGWAGELYPFVKSTGAYHCPNDVQDGAFVSYAENQNLVKQNYVNLPASAATVAPYEFTTLNCDPTTAETVSATGLSAPQDSRRHDGGPGTAFGLNFLAVDGHVKFLTPEEVSGGPNAVRAKGLPSGKIVETFAVR